MQCNIKVARKVQNLASMLSRWTSICWLPRGLSQFMLSFMFAIRIYMLLCNYDLTFSDRGRMAIRWWCQRPSPGNWEAVSCLQAAESVLRSTGSEPPCFPHRNEPELAGTQRPLPPDCTERECRFHWTGAPSFWWGSGEFSAASGWSGQSGRDWTESLGWGSRHDSPPGSLTPEKEKSYSTCNFLFCLRLYVAPCWPNNTTVCFSEP